MSRSAILISWDELNSTKMITSLNQDIEHDYILILARQFKIKTFKYKNHANISRVNKSCQEQTCWFWNYLSNEFKNNSTKFGKVGYHHSMLRLWQENKL